MNHVYYWKGAEGAQTLLDEHREDILRLLSGDYPHNDLEKLRGNHQHNVYSFRTNQAGRLLFTTRTLHDKHYLHVLEYLPTHDYHKSRFLQHQVLKHYLNAQTTPEFDTLTTHDIKPAFEASAESTSLQPIALDFFNKQFIQLRDEQHAIVNQSLPLIINGVGGSGKTYIALNVLEQFITNHTEHEPARILYVTKEASLVNTIKRHWDDLILTVPQHIQIEFLTYNELLAQHATIDASTQEMNHYNNWLSTQKKSSTDIDERLQFNEFRLCALFSQTDYQALGEHQSAIPATQRQHIYLQYQRYQNYLTQQNLIDTVFYLFTANPTYALIVVDEAQNFALPQLHNIHQLAFNQAILYCMDPQQNLMDQAPIRKLLQQLHWTPEHPLPSVQLNRTYRCATQVIHAVNTLLQAKYDILGKIDKTENLITHDSLNETGYVALTTSITLHAHQSILDRHTSNHFAVITHEDLREEAQYLFNTPLVFTVKEIQGLEYHTVLVYKLLSDKTSQNNLKIIHKPLIDPDHQKYSKQTKEEHQYLAPWFNTIYTAYTRAQHTLLICEDIPTNRNGLIELLKKNIAPLTPNAAPIITPNLPATDWVDEAKRQQDIGNHNIKKSIQKHLAPKKSTANTEARIAITENKSIETKARNVFNRFAENDFIRNWIQTPDFITTLFDTRLRLDDKPKQNLFSHIADSSQHTARFSIAIGLYPASILTEAFVTRAIKQTKLPEKIKEQILLNLITTDKTIHNVPDIKRWLLKCFNEIIESINFVSVNDSTLQKRIKGMLNYQILDASTRQAFVKKLTYIDPITHLTILLGLVASDVTFLKNLMDNDPLSIPMIPNDVWSLTPLQETGFFHKISMLFSLSVSAEGLSVILRLMKDHPNIIHAIPPNAWALAQTNKTGFFENTSPLYFFTKNPDGLSVLALFIERYPTIINAIPPTAWTLAQTDKAQNLENTSPLYNLTSHSSGLNILKTLINQHPNVIQNIPPKAWALPRTRKACAHDNRTPLFNLTLNSYGHEILKTLICKHTDVIKNIPTNAWTLAQTDKAGKFENLSPLFLLTQADEKTSVLKLLIDKLPSIINTIAPTAWSLPLTHNAYINENVSPLYNLTSHSSGINILKTLINQHPNVIENIPFEAWALARTHHACAKENRSPLFNLMMDTSGREILEILIDHYPQIIRNIPPTAWALSLSPKAHTYLSPLDYLTKSTDCVAILNKLIKKLPDIAEVLGLMAKQELNSTPPSNMTFFNTNQQTDDTTSYAKASNLKLDG